MTSIHNLIILTNNIINIIDNIKIKINNLSYKLNQNNQKANFLFINKHLNLNYSFLLNNHLLNNDLLNNNKFLTDKLQKLSDNNNFFDIAYILSNLVIKKYPTYRPCELDDIIHGNYCWLKKKANNLGYWGWKLINCISISPENRLLPSQLKNLANQPEINEYLKFINSLFNIYLIIPITNQIKKYVQNNENYYQNQIAKNLNLDKIENLLDIKKGYIISEIISKMEDQDIITSYIYKNKKYFKDSHMFHNEFRPGLYKSPRCKLSKPQLFCIQIIEEFLINNNLLKDFSLEDEYIIKDNIYNQNSKLKARPRIDIALIDKNTNKILLAIESDGKQHDEIVSHFQRNGISDLNKQKIRDQKKDEWIYNNTNFKCIRVKDIYYKDGIRNEPTGLEKKNYLLIKLNNFLDEYNKLPK